MSGTRVEETNKKLLSFSEISEFIKPMPLTTRGNTTAEVITEPHLSSEINDESNEEGRASAGPSNPLPDHRERRAGHVGPALNPVVSRNLWFFIWLKAIGSYDSGAFSAVLGTQNGIAEQWSLSSVDQGLLTSSVFLGNVLGCPLAGHLFSQKDEKKVFGYSLFFHMVFTFLFGIFQDFTLALINRFFIGLTLAFIVVYTPVWVDEFAPKSRQSMWMALQNAGVPLGIMFGYILGALFPTYLNLGWDLSFYIKGFLMIPTVVYLAKVDRRTINTKNSTASTETGGELSASGSRRGNSLRLRLRGFLTAMRHLMTNIVYVSSTLSMCCLYFAATGLQNFVTPYLRGEPFNAPMKTIMIGFGVAVVTAPVCGVIAGGLLLDRIGGYSSDVLRTTLFALVCGAMGGVCAIICIFVETTGTFLFVMSILLFCGGAIIPPGIGLTMSSLPNTRRSAGAALSQTMYNLLGNFSGPLVCGFVTDATGNLRYGIMTILLSSVLGIFPLFGIVLLGWVSPHRLKRADPPPMTSAEAVVITTLPEVEVEPEGVAVAETMGDSHRSERESPLSTVRTSGQLPNFIAPETRPLHVLFQSATTQEGTEHSVASPGPSGGEPPLSYANSVEDVLLERLMSRRYSGDNEELEQTGISVRQSSHVLSPGTRTSTTRALRRPSVRIVEEPNVQWNESLSIPNQHNFGLDLVRSILHTQSSFADAGSSSSTDEEEEDNVEIRNGSAGGVLDPSS